MISVAERAASNSGRSCDGALQAARDVRRTGADNRKPGVRVRVAAAVHRGIASWQRRHPFVYAVRAASASPRASSSCPSMSHIFQDDGNFSRPSASSLRSSTASPTSRSTMADFIHTRSLAPPRSRIFASKTRARSGSRFSNSSLNAASQMSSDSGLTTKASSKTSRAPGTSPHSHRSFAAMSHNISALGQCTTARFSKASIAALSPTDFSSFAASTHRPFLAGNIPHACAKMARAVCVEPRFSHSAASAFHVRFMSSSSTPAPTVTRTISRHTASAGGSFFSAASASLSQYSRSTDTPWFPRDLTARSTILPTIAPLPLASSSFAAVIQMAGSVGSVSRALFRTFRACS